MKKQVLLTKPDYEIYMADSRIFGHIFGGPTYEFATEEEAYEYLKEV